MEEVIRLYEMCMVHLYNKNTLNSYYNKNKKGR